MNQILKDIRVLDLTHYMAGPFCTMILADLGAEVIKIEPPWGEALRMSPPLVKGISPQFLFLNRNKKGMTLNLKTDIGLDIFKKLVKESDVVIENFKPGTMDNFGLNYEALKNINSKIIFVSVSGFGQTGPYSSRPSFDSIAQAYSGIMTLTADLHDPDGPPIQISDFIGDSIPALYATIGIIAALYYRQSTGEGQRIDLAQMDSLLSILPSIVSHMLTGLTIPQTQKEYFTGITGIYRAKDGYVVLAPEGRLLDNLARAMKVKNIDNRQIICDWVKNKSINDVVNELMKEGVPVAPILNVEKVITNPQVLARDIIVDIKNPQGDELKVLAVPIKFSESPVQVKSFPPLLGQHNEEILSNLLPYSKRELNELKKRGVI